jgi:hypothetical protein
VAGVSNQTQSSGAAIGPLSFFLADAETDSDALTISAASSNPTLLPSAGIMLGGSGTTRTITLAPATNEFGTAVVTLTASDGSLSGSFSFAVTINNGASVSGNAPPIIGGVASQVVAAGQKVGPLNFVVADAVTNNGSLTVTALSSNPTLTPTIQVGGTASSRTVTLTPAAGQTGTATITLSTTDGGGLVAKTAFLVTVTPANTPPSIAGPANQIVTLSSVPPLLNFTVSDGETPAARLWVTARSSNQALLPNSGLALGGADESRTLAFTPMPGQTGAATVTLTVTDDGGMSAMERFLFVVTDPSAPASRFLRPKGIYSLDSALGGTYNGSSLRDGNIRDYPFVDGYVLHVVWDTVEISPGVYDFFIIQNALNKLPIGQKLSLILSPDEPADIATTPDVTTWVDSSGGSPVTRAVPWDPYLRQRRAAFLHALASTLFDGVALRDHPRLSALNPFLPGGNGGLRDPLPQTLDGLPGYTRAKLLGAVQDELRTLSAEFPRTYVQMGFWPVLDGENAAYGGLSAWEWMRQQLLAEFNGLVRPHIGFFMDNLSANRQASGQDPPTGFPNTSFAAPMFLSRDAEFNGFQALGPWIQPFRSGTSNNMATNTLNGTPADGIETGYNTFGATYAEIYAIDLDVAAFQPLLQRWHDFFAGIEPDAASDEDGDSLPLGWEQENNLNPRVNSGDDGAAGDPDGDQKTNKTEFVAGTLPRDATSRFEIGPTKINADGSVSGTYPVVAGRSYTVQYSTDMAIWSKLHDAVASVTGTADFTDPSPGDARRFYRVVTPAVP